MKIVCVMPIYRRVAITIKTIERLKQQTYPLSEIIVIGSCADDKFSADKTGVEYLEHANDPLSQKWQAGIYHAKKLDPDAILINGSDSWLSTNWCEVAKPYIEEGNHIIGKTTFYSCRLNPKQDLLILNKTYRDIRKDPVGAGRLISKEALEAIDWKLYTGKRNWGMDKISFDSIESKLKQKTKVAILNNHEESAVMGIKSTQWHTLNPFKQAKSNKFVKAVVVKKPAQWVEEHFPGALGDFKELVPEVIIK